MQTYKAWVHTQMGDCNVTRENRPGSDSMHTLELYCN